MTEFNSKSQMKRIAVQAPEKFIEEYWRMREQVREAREVIEFYANEAAWEIKEKELGRTAAGFIAVVDTHALDDGTKARDFLAKYPTEGK